MREATKTAQTQNGETLLIRGKEIPVLTTTLRQDTLRFFVDNPRVYSVLRKDGTAEPSQEEIQAKLLDMDHVKELIHDIKRDGGLTDPIIVRDGTLEVLEGNSRLAAYRHLVNLDPIKWGMVKVRLLPEDMDEKLILALLGQYHLKGKGLICIARQGRQMSKRASHSPVGKPQNASIARANGLDWHIRRLATAKSKIKTAVAESAPVEAHIAEFADALSECQRRFSDLETACEEFVRLCRGPV